MKYLPLFLLLVGCSKYTGPYKMCLKDHLETYTVILPVGKTVVPQVRVKTVCDEWSVQEYIKVDKKIYEVQYVYEEKE